MRGLFASVVMLSVAPSAIAQEADQEARTIFRAWENLDTSQKSVPAPPTAIWSAQNALGEVFWINKKDLTSNGNWVSFWMNGFHITNPKVNYRRSLWKMTILCPGTLRFEAYTKYGADGSVLEEIDYRTPQQSAIRPGTMYATIAEEFCPS